MDRYIIREPRISEFPPNMQNSNQILAITAGNESEDEGMFLERPLRRYPVYLQCPPAFKLDLNNMQMNSPSYMVNCLPPAQAQRPAISGIDPRYLAAYADPNSSYIANGLENQHHGRDSFPANTVTGGNHQNRKLPERNMAQPFMSTERQQEQTMIIEPPKPFQKSPQTNWKPLENKSPQETMILQTPKPYHKESHSWQAVNYAPTKKIEASDANKPEIQNQIMSRADKLKALHRSGARVFSGPVEKIIKWHKTLQDIGVYVIYEIVAKCVSIRPGENCAKNLVVRDDSGPAMQIVYYEVDFLLPQLTPPCTVRIVGRMMAGTCRFQAFNVRSATGDDVATLPRRAAVAAHHVAKLCKEYAL